MPQSVLFCGLATRLRPAPSFYSMEDPAVAPSAIVPPTGELHLTQLASLPSFCYRIQVGVDADHCTVCQSPFEEKQRVRASLRLILGSHQADADVAAQDGSEGGVCPCHGTA